MLSAERKARRQQTFALPINELECRFNVLYANLHHTVASIVLYAQVAKQSKHRSQKLTALHLRFKGHWRDLADTVDAIHSYAVLLQHNEQMSRNLAYLLREQTQFLQAITSPEDITPEWVAKRNALAVLACKFVDDDQREDDSSQISSSHLL